MIITNKTRSRSLLVVLGCLSLTMLAGAQTNTTPLPAVNPGSQAGAEAYYKRLSGDLKFLTPETILTSNLDHVLQYLGYKGLHAVDLETLASDVLMDFDKLKVEKLSNHPEFDAQFPNAKALPPGNILVTRFFSPKITDDSHLPPAKVGWRKLVRLVPNRNQDSSDAMKAVAEAYILFNFFQADLTKSPFDPTNGSVNTQVALVSTADFAKHDPKQPKDPLYWLDFTTRDKGFNINFELDATFDARDPDLQVKPYFVPDACAACHNNKNKPLLNYMDTDHWIDRVQGGDFVPLAASPWPVLFDAGTKDESSPQFQIAFNAIRTLNSKIAAQNAGGNPAAFQTIAAQNWLRLHATSTVHIQPIDRAIPTPPATQSWVKGKDEAILGLLNGYCFRCHGSVGFNVFDKGSVLSRANIDPASK